jgi:topoisomerase-4 subunit A
VYKRIEKSKTEKQIKKEVYTGMEPFKKSFIREMTDEDVKKLLEIRIRRISAYDREKYKGEIDDIAVSIEQCESKLKSLTRTVISFLKDLIDKYEPLYPRKTEISTFETIDKKSVARANIRMGYDAESRYFGSMVRSRDIQIEASEYDRILIVTNDGTFRIIGPVEKLFLPGDILYCRIFNPKRGARFTLAYRDNQDIAWGKRVVIEKFIKDKMYSLFPESKRGIIYFTEKRHADLIQLNFIRSKRQKLKKAEYDLDTLGKSSFASRGTRLHAKPVESIEVLKREKQKQSPAKKPSKSSLLTKAKGIKSITRPKKKKKST